MGKRILGLLGFVLGAVGILLCLAIIIGAWWVNGPVTANVLRVFPPIESALLFGDKTADTFTVFVNDTQSQFNTTADAKVVASKLEAQIQQTAVYVTVATGLVNSAEETVLGIESSAQTVDGARGNGIARAAGQLGDRLGNLDETLTFAGTLASEVREGRTERIDDLNTQLDKLETQSAEIQTTISQTQTEVDDVKRKIPRWINLGSLILTLIFLWFGIAQYLLFKKSWQMIRQPKRIK